MSQRPDSVLHRPEGVSQRPGSVPQRPDFLQIWQDVQDVLVDPGGVTARLRRALAPCRSSPGGLTQSARGRWLNATKPRGRFRSSNSTESSAIETECCSLTLEGRCHGFSFGVQLGFFRVCGKCKESVGLMSCKADGNRLESPVLSRFCRGFSRLQRDSADLTVAAGESQINSNEKAVDSNLDMYRKQGCDAGKIGEVGPPASGRSCFTLPYSRRWHSTGILPCGACGGRSSWGAP